MEDQKKYSKIESNVDELVQIVNFSLGDEDFGVDIQAVKEINRIVELTKLPESSEFVDGLANLRGSIIPVVNLRKRFRMSEKEHDVDSRIIIVTIEKGVIGFAVDSVKEVLRISREVIENVPQFYTNVDTAYISGVAKLEDRLIVLLDLNKVLSEEEAEYILEAA